MFSIDEMISFLPPLLGGAYLTISVSLLSFGLAAIIGLMMGIARISRSLLLRAIATPYVQFIRGTPLLLQLFFIYYVLPYSGIVLSPFVSGVMGLTLNYSAYMAEVFRGGIVAIPKGQWEAGLSVGMSRKLLMRRIILPQALRIVVPAIGNFFVSIFKDSALVSVITMRDLMFSGRDPRRRHLQAFRDLRDGGRDLLPDQLPLGEARRIYRSSPRYLPRQAAAAPAHT